MIMREVRNFIVRIIGGDINNIPVGCGFLIGTDKRHIFTCCHVVNAALNRREITKPSEIVLLDFPFLAPNFLFKAEVDRWHFEINDVLHDICVLKLLDEIPVDAKPAPFVQADDYSGDAFRAFGFPDGFEDNGREVKGILGAKQVNGRVLAEGISQFGYFIEQGFSGTPIWNSTRGGVCGMAFQVDTPAAVKVASITPAEQLMQVAPDLIELRGIVTNYLRWLIADLESRRGVLQYVDLSGQTKVSNDDQSPFLDIDDEFGFSELVPKQHTDQKEPIYLGKIRDVLDRHSRFVLIGEAGSSKTTTIRRLVLEAARKRLLDDNAPLPLLLYLPRWESGLTAEEFIYSQWVASELAEYGDPMQLLKSGAVLLYLDGLNEMGGQSGENAKKLKSWLSSSDAPQSVIVTCRKDNYAGDFQLDLPIVQIESMSDEHIQQFVQNYIPDKAEALLKRILPKDNQGKQDKRHLYHLVRNPYMLAALIVVFVESPDKELPLNNGQLFQLLVRALGKREAKRFSRGWLPFDECFAAIEKALANLAFAMINENKGTEISVEYAGRYLDNTILNASYSANYLDITESGVHFYHQLMLEYFATLMMLSDFNQNVESTKYWPKLEKPQRVPDVFEYLEELTSLKWDTVVGMLLGIVPNVLAVFSWISKSRPSVAMQWSKKFNINISDYVDQTLQNNLEIIEYKISQKIRVKLKRNHAMHYLKLLATFIRKFEREQSTDVLDKFYREWDQIQHAFENLLDHATNSVIISGIFIDACSRLLSSRLFRLISHLTKRRHLLLFASQLLKKFEADTLSIISINVNLALVEYELGNLASASAICQNLLFEPSLAQHHKDNVIWCLAMVNREQGDSTSALSLLNEIEVIGDDQRFFDSGELLTCFGVIYKDRGDQPEAKKFFEAALSYFQESNNSIGLAYCLAEFATINFDKEEVAQSLSYVEESLLLHTKLFNLEGEIRTLLHMSELLRKTGSTHKAVEISTDALNKAQATGRQLLIIDALLTLAHSYADLSENIQAVQLAEQAFVMCNRFGAWGTGRMAIIELIYKRNSGT